ncbi:MAG: HPr family phosphocarrier protein [Oscillospiraceae bacterium]|nr:HPr family phosphocarrier protein [Oscillospiraceae bacterium]
MKKTEVILSNINEVRDFVNLVILMNYEVDLMQGKHLINAKSVMGIFSLDLLSPITVIAHNDNTDDFFKKLEKFKVKECLK